jgi:hypothetical protein
MPRPSNDPRLRKGPPERFAIQRPAPVLPSLRLAAGKPPSLVHWPAVAVTAAGCLVALAVLLLALHRTPRPGPEPDQRQAQARAVEDELSRSEEAFRRQPAPPTPQAPPAEPAPARTETPPVENGPRQPPEPPPEEPPPPPPRRKPPELAAEDLRQQLLQVPEVDFFALADRLKNDLRKDVADQLRRADPGGAVDARRRRLLEEAGRAAFVARVNALVLQDARQQGLPVQTGPSCRADAAVAAAMQKLSRALRLQQIVASPGLPRDGDALARFRRWVADNPLDDDAGTRRVLLQTLQVEPEPERQLLVAELARGKDPEAVAALANRALFDPAAAVRRAATVELQKDAPAGCRDLLLRGLRYPWAPVADHAAEALVRLNDRQAIPALLELLDRPDPALPQRPPGEQEYVVRELVRVRHLHNCYLCHPAVPVLQAPVGGFVPEDGRSVPPLYYSEAKPASIPGGFVRADITFVRQDFSVLQPTPDAGPGLTEQRFDFLVRNRPARPEEVARLKEPAAASYPQREAVLFALRELTGQDYGPSTPAWIDGLGLRPPAEPAAPPDLPAQAPPGRRPALAAELAALDVGPLGRSHLRSLSPDGRRVAVAEGNRIVIAAAGSLQPLFVLEGHQAAVTSVWWSLDGDTVAADDAEGMVIVYDANKGLQRVAFFKR